MIQNRVGKNPLVVKTTSKKATRYAKDFEKRLFRGQIAIGSLNRFDV